MALALALVARSRESVASDSDAAKEDRSARRLMTAVEQAQRSGDRVFSMDIAIEIGSFRTARRILGVSSSAGGLTRILYIMTAPSFFRGATLLIHDPTDPRRADRMWITFPGLNEAAREVEATSLRLMVPGTGLSYEDSRGWIATDKYRFESLRQDSGTATIEAVPRTDSLARILGTARLVVRVDPARRVVLGTEYYDEAGTLAKRYEASDFEPLGGNWYPGRVRTHVREQQMDATITYHYRKLPGPPPSDLLVLNPSGAPALDRLRAWRDRAGFGAEFPDTLAGH
jgi:hypothetical protein